MSKGKKAALALFLLILCFAAAGQVFGFWEAQQNTDNFLTMSSYKARVEEKYEIPNHVNPSEEVEKTVHVRNEGTVDILVRVQVEKAFGTRDSKGNFIKDETLDGENILITFDDTFWEKRGDWFYYREILKAGQRTRKPLMQSYRLSPLVGNEYKGKEARILITMESVQAKGGAAESLWGIKPEDLGIQWPKAAQAEAVSVIFQGRDEGFAVKAKNTDLFASFKNLLPGCARAQEIRIQNEAAEPVELFLRARETKQGSMSREQKELVRQLLEQYAQIEVRQQDQILYRGAVCGEDETGSMREDISLGQFAAGASKTLTVRLSLDAQMDNRYQALTGKVSWVFSARGEDGTVVEREVPVTGDGTRVGMWTALFALSGGAMWLALMAERKSRRREIDALSEENH